MPKTHGTVVRGFLQGTIIHNNSIGKINNYCIHKKKKALAKLKTLQETRAKFQKCSTAICQKQKLASFID